MPGAAYFITTCLEGSIPARGLLDLTRYRDELQRRPRPDGVTAAQWADQQWKLAFAQAERWLDREPAVRHLADPRLARLVVNALYHFAGQRYDLLAFVVMPSHFHWVFQPRELWIAQRKASTRTPREEIVHSINSFTAHQANEVLGRTGVFWQHECYDHWVRNVDELERIIRYIEANPVAASLVASPEEWEFSSAHDRFRHGLAFGEPLWRQASGLPGHPGKPEACPHRPEARP
jgi:type I restriction enzyme R subunit